MSTYVKPGETRPVIIGPLPTGLAGSIGVRVESATDAILRARSTAGVTEFATGWYRVSLTFDAAWSGRVYVVADAPDGREGIEEFEVSLRPTVAPVDWRPTVEEVATAIRSRTYQDGKPDSDPDDEILDNVVGGSQAGTFTENTDPTDEEVEAHITDACADVLIPFLSGAVPEASYSAARRAATLKAALAVELSKFRTSGGAENSPYIQLRIDADNAMKALLISAQTRDLFAE